LNIVLLLIDTYFRLVQPIFRQTQHMLYRTIVNYMGKSMQT